MDQAKATPRPGGIFAPRARIQTIQAALEKFAARLTEPNAAQNIAQIIADGILAGESVCVKISLTVHRDTRSEGDFVVKLSTEKKNELSKDTFAGLHP